MPLLVAGCFIAAALGILLVVNHLPALGFGLVTAGLGGLIALCTIVSAAGKKLVEADIVGPVMFEVFTSPISFVILGASAVGIFLLLYMVDNTSSR